MLTRLNSIEKNITPNKAWFMENSVTLLLIKKHIYDEIYFHNLISCKRAMR
jgi:hypothetical protein